MISIRIATLPNTKNVVITIAIMKSTKANCACTVPLMDGLGRLAFTRGLPLVACGESDTG